MRIHRLITLLLFIVACKGEDDLFSGSIEIDEVRVSARVGGQIEELNVGQGDAVTEGQLLLKLDETQYVLELARGEAALAVAQAGLETLLAGTREQQILSASSSVEAARALMTQMDTDLLRAQDLFSAGAMSRQSLQAAETHAVQALTQYNSAVQSYSLALEGARSTEIRAGEAQVASADASVQMAVSQLEWTAVLSPVSGIVTGRTVLQGENVQAGMTLLTVASLDTVRVIFYISEPLLSRISTGDHIEVSATGGEAVSAIVTSIADQAEFTPSTVETRDGRTSLVYRVEGTVPNITGVFKAGMPVDVRLTEL